MNLAKGISILVLSLCLIGCSVSEPTYKIKYEQVEVPVIVPIDKPNRPIYSNTDSVPTYLLKVLEYTNILEVLIEEHNKGAYNVKT